MSKSQKTHGELGNLMPVDAVKWKLWNFSTILEYYNGFTFSPPQSVINDEGGYYEIPAQL
jgi:hypothetical protein